uniref:Methyl-CpG binding protein 2 n=1 Tax=Homo sapiens TaxID=9606 RepID=A0AAQ5BGE7_HUMAN
MVAGMLGLRLCSSLTWQTRRSLSSLDALRTLRLASAARASSPKVTPFPGQHPGD